MQIYMFVSGWIYICPYTIYDIKIYTYVYIYQFTSFYLMMFLVVFSSILSHSIYSIINYQWQINHGSGWSNVVSPPSGQLASYTPPAGSVTITTSFRRLVSITNSITWYMWWGDIQWIITSWNRIVVLVCF